MSQHPGTGKTSATIFASIVGCVAGTLVGATLLTGWIVAQFTFLRSVPAAETGPIHPGIAAIYFFFMTSFIGLVFAAPVSLVFNALAGFLSRRIGGLFHPLVWALLGALASTPIYMLVQSDPGMQFGTVEAVILAIAGAAGGYASNRATALHPLKSAPETLRAPRGRSAF